jgi:hypothetical protein
MVDPDSLQIRYAQPVSAGVSMIAAAQIESSQGLAGSAELHAIQVILLPPLPQEIDESVDIAQLCVSIFFYNPSGMISGMSAKVEDTAT